jgi:hypothetical protein
VRPFCTKNNNPVRTRGRCRLLLGLFASLASCLPLKISDMPLNFGELFLALSDPTPKSSVTWGLTLHIFSQISTETFDLNPCVNYRNKTFYVGLYTCMSPAPPISTLYKLYVCTERAGIATRYVLDCPGVESRWRARLSAPVETGPGDHPCSYTMGVTLATQPQIRRG